jgi:O-antigen/teichoic acid export membrane protein
MTARLLGQEGYGRLGILVSTYALFSQLGGLGLGDTVTKHVAELRESDPAKAGQIAGAAMTTAWLSYSGMAAVLAIFAAPISSSLLNAPALCTPLRLSSLYLIAAGVNGVQVGVLAGLEDFKAIARINAMRAVVNLPVTIVAALWLGVDGVVGAMVLVMVATATLSRAEIRRAALKSNVALHYHVESSHVQIFWRFSLPAFLAGNLVVPASWVANAMLVHQPNGYAEMGLLNAANQWRALAVLIPGIASSVTLPIHSNLYGAVNRARYHRSVVANLGIQALLSALVVGTLVTLGPVVLEAYGREFRAGTSAFLWLALSWLFLAPNWIMWGVMVSSNRVWLGLFFNGIGAVTLLSFAWLWRSQGATGIAMAYCIAGLAQFALQGGHFVTWRKAQLS